MDITGYSTIQQTRRNPSKTTSAYNFISTRAVLAMFSELGWFPTQVRESGVRLAENQGFQRHLVRLQNHDFDRREINVGDAIPEIVVKNSHSGESALRLYSGIHEKICTNGLIIEHRADAIRIPHLGFSAWMIEPALKHLTVQLREAFKERERWRNILLKPDEKLALADAAIPLRFDRKFMVEPHELLRPRRSQQADPSLWSVFNTIEEALIRGNVPQGRRDGTVFRSRALKSVDDEVRINQKLWRLASELEKALKN